MTNDEEDHKEQVMPKILFIRAEWDDEADVWVATSDDVPGLATEAETIEALSSKLQIMVPELLDANGYPDGPEVPFELLARKFSIAHREAA
jgi:predicted RNase H-like HicB family nuclease